MFLIKAAAFHDCLRLICVLSLHSLFAYSINKDIISVFSPYAGFLSYVERLDKVQNRTCGYQVSIAYDKSSASKADILLLPPKGG